MKKALWIVAACGVALAAAAPAAAHPFGHDAGFAGGFAHPFAGWDHLLAMTALGLWIGARQAYTGIAVVVAALGMGFVLGIGGVHVPLVEPAILASVMVLGLAVAARLPASITLPAVAAFMVFHGHAHGTEAPRGALVLYAAGFICASLLIVLGAAALVRPMGHRHGAAIVRYLGLVIAGAGAALGLA